MTQVTSQVTSQHTADKPPQAKDRTTYHYTYEGEVPAGDGASTSTSNETI